MTPDWHQISPDVRIACGDCLTVLRTMEAESVNCVVTSPPYWGLRDYGTNGQLGLEATPEQYVAKMVGVFREVRRVLRSDGTLWLNMGDSYAVGKLKTSYNGDGSADLGWTNKRSRKAPLGLKPKDLVGIPWRLAFALQADGWWLRSDIIWSKPNPMPESVTDRPTKAHEYVFLMTKSARYFYDAEAVKERSEPSSGGFQSRAERGLTVHGNGETGQALGRGGFVAYTGLHNRRTVWEIPTQPYPEAHFATFPEKLVEPCILAGCPRGGTVLDPFAGSGTTLLVAAKHGHKAIGIELKPEYLELARKRVSEEASQGKFTFTGESE